MFNIAWTLTLLLNMAPYATCLPTQQASEVRRTERSLISDQQLSLPIAIVTDSDGSFPVLLVKNPSPTPLSSGLTVERLITSDKRSGL
jgi:hypothetical protein